MKQDEPYSGGKLSYEDHMPWGKFVGTKMKHIDARYLLWLKDNVSPSHHNQAVFDYIEENLQVLQHEAKHKPFTPHQL